MTPLAFNSPAVSTTETLGVIICSLRMSLLKLYINYMENKEMTIKELVQSEGWINFSKRLENYSAILLGVIVLMLIAGYSESKNFNLILTITLTMLSILCFFIGFQTFDSESKVLTYWFYKIYGFGLAIGFLTLLFISQDWSFPKEILTVLSTVFIFVSLFLGFKEKTSGNKNSLDWKYFLRLFIALIPLLYVLS